MDAFALIAENRILEAQKEGAFDHLEGEGKPLQNDANPLVPDDLKMAYKVLKNSGFLPQEIAERKEIDHLFELLENKSPEAERLAAIRRLEAITFSMARKGKSIAMGEKDAYLDAVLQRLSAVKSKNL